MKKLTTILFGLILISFLFLPYLQGKEPERKKEVQTRKENIKQKEVVEQTQKEAKAQNQQPMEKEPELIWQRDFGSEIRRFKLHKTIDAREFPILAVETKDALIIFDKKGNEKIRRSIPQNQVVIEGKEVIFRGFVVVSDNGEYVLEGKGIPESSYDLKYTTVDGKMLWEKKNFYGELEVSPDGSRIVLLNTKGGKNQEGSVEFYSESGKLLKQHSIDLFSIGIPLYKFSFSDDGNYFVLRLEQWIENKKGRRAIYPVILFDKKGNLLWQKNIEVTPGRTALFVLLISPKGSYISYSSDKYVYVVDNKGNLLWKKEFHNVLSFSEKEDILLMRDDKKNMFFITNSRTGEIYWSKERGTPIISPNGTLLGIIKRTSEAEGEMLTLHIMRMKDKKERLILKRRYLHPQKREFQFSSNGKRLYLIEQEPETKLSVYELDLFNRN